MAGVEDLGDDMRGVINLAIQFSVPVFAAKAGIQRLFWALALAGATECMDWING